MGLEVAASFSWAWKEVGLLASKNWGLASFCIPAKVKVNPTKARRGRRAQPDEAAEKGDPTHSRRVGPS
jgi:hypothetical protein